MTSKQIAIKNEIADRLKYGRNISYSEAIEELFDIERLYDTVKIENFQLHGRIEVLRFAKKKKKEVRDNGDSK